MNHISVASPLLPATVSKQKQQPTDQLLISVMRAVLPPQEMWATTCGICTAQVLAGYRRAAGLHCIGDAGGAQPPAAGSHKPTRATTVPATKSFSLPCHLSSSMKCPTTPLSFLQEYGSKSKFLIQIVVAPPRSSCFSCCSVHLCWGVPYPIPASDLGY